MTPQDWEAALRRTATDRKLSGPERQALAERLGTITAQQAAALRSRAFDIARAEMPTPDSAEWVVWLEEVVKLLHPVTPGTSATSEAMFTPEDDIAGRIAVMFRSAKRSVEVCVFTITDDRIAEAMIAAHRRGVAIRVITDNDKSLDLGADIQRLEAAGLALVMDRTPAHMHHKFAIFDRAVLLNGSYNWTRSAQSANCENVTITSERRLIEAFLDYFERRYQQLGG